MKAFLHLALLFASALCANADWLPREIHEVRAYFYDYTQEKQNSLLNQGKLHEGVINVAGAKLTKQQTERLMHSLQSGPVDRSSIRLACYLPHHGFVFFDRDGIAMGHIELCFQCRGGRSSPTGPPESEWNWGEIRKLLKEHKIPILENDADYTKLYLAEKAKREYGTGKFLNRPGSKSQGGNNPLPETERRPRLGDGDIVIRPPTPVTVRKVPAHDSSRARIESIKRKLPETISPLTATQLDTKVPHSYYFDYDFEPQPGKRIWRRVDSETWHEIYPDGLTSVFKVLGHTTVSETEGTIVVKWSGDSEETMTTNDGGFQAFIPDLGSATMHHWYRNTVRGDTTWTDLAPMKDVK